MPSSTIIKDVSTVVITNLSSLLRLNSSSSSFTSSLSSGAPSGSAALSSMSFWGHAASRLEPFILTKTSPAHVVGPFPVSLAATVNLTWLCSLDSFLSGRRYYDSHLELILSLLPTLTLIIYYSPLIGKTLPFITSFFLEYIALANWLLFLFYSWEISKTLACLAAQHPLLSPIMFPQLLAQTNSNSSRRISYYQHQQLNGRFKRRRSIISGRRNYTILYLSAFAYPLLVVSLRRYYTWPGLLNGYYFAFILILKAWFPFDDIQMAFSQTMYLVGGWFVNGLVSILRRTSFLLVSRGRVGGSYGKLSKRSVIAATFPPEAKPAAIIMKQRSYFTEFGGGIECDTKPDSHEVCSTLQKDFVSSSTSALNKILKSVPYNSPTSSLFPPLINPPESVTNSSTILPPELILLIIRHNRDLDLEEIKAARLVCRSWADAIAPLTFRRICISSSSQMRDICEQQVFSTGSAMWIEFTRYLTLKGCVFQSPSSRPPPPSSSSSSSNSTNNSITALLRAMPNLEYLDLSELETPISNNPLMYLKLAAACCPRLMVLKVGKRRVKMGEALKLHFQKNRLSSWLSRIPSWTSQSYFGPSSNIDDGFNFLIGEREEEGNQMDAYSPQHQTEPRIFQFRLPTTTTASSSPTFVMADSTYSFLKPYHRMMITSKVQPLAHLDLSGCDLLHSPLSSSSIMRAQMMDNSSSTSSGGGGSVLEFLAGCTFLVKSLRVFRLARCRNIDDLELVNFVIRCSALECLDVGETDISGFVVQEVMRILLNGSSTSNITVGQSCSSTLSCVVLRRVASVKAALLQLPEIMVAAERHRVLNSLQLQQQQQQRIKTPTYDNCSSWCRCAQMENASDLIYQTRRRNQSSTDALSQVSDALQGVCFSLDVSETDLSDDQIDSLLALSSFTSAITCVNLRGNSHISGHAVCQLIQGCLCLKHLNVTDCCGAIRSSQLAEWSDAVFPPAVAFSANLRGREMVEKAQRIIFTQDEV